VSRQSAARSTQTAEGNANSLRCRRVYWAVLSLERESGDVADIQHVGRRRTKGGVVAFACEVDRPSSGASELLLRVAERSSIGISHPLGQTV